MRLRVAAGVLAAATLLAGCSFASYDPPIGATSLQVVRDAGLLALPPLDRTVTDQNAIQGITGDIATLPVLPNGTLSCPIDFGVSYRLDFSLAFKGSVKPLWGAEVSPAGCEVVRVSTGRVLTAAHSQRLFLDLEAVLGLTSDQFDGHPCPDPGRQCYAPHVPYP